MTARAAGGADRQPRAVRRPGDPLGVDPAFDQCGVSNVSHAQTSTPFSVPTASWLPAGDQAASHAGTLFNDAELPDLRDGIGHQRR